MLTSLKERLEARRDAEFEGEGVGDSGFTLIELMVVLLILAILLAIAIPTFLGVTNSANDRAAQANINTTFQDAKGIYESNNQQYPAIATLSASLSTNEPSLAGSFQTNPATALTVTGASPKSIGMYVSNDQNGFVVMALASKTNECWVLADNTAQITPAAGTTDASVYEAANGTPPGIPESPGDYYGNWNVATGAGAGGAALPCEIDNLIKLAATNTQHFPTAQ